MFWVVISRPPPFWGEGAYAASYEGRHHSFTFPSAAIPCSCTYGFPYRPSFWDLPPLSRELLSWPMELGIAPSAFPITSRAKGSSSTAFTVYICSVHFSSLGARTRGSIVWCPTCCSSYPRAAHYYPWCRVSCLARFFLDSDHYSDGYYGADGPLTASAGLAESHSPWDSAAPRSFATSSTCCSCALKAFCFNWWFCSSWWCYTCSSTFYSCSWGPLLSTRGAYHLIIRSLLSLFCIYVLYFWMWHIFWTTFILGLDVFHVYLVYCTLSVYIDIFLFLCILAIPFYFLYSSLLSFLFLL